MAQDPGGHVDLRQPGDPDDVDLDAAIDAAIAKRVEKKRRAAAPLGAKILDVGKQALRGTAEGALGTRIGFNELTGDTDEAAALRRDRDVVREWAGESLSPIATGAGVTGRLAYEVGEFMVPGTVLSKAAKVVGAGAKAGKVADVAATVGKAVAPGKGASVARKVGTNVALAAPLNVVKAADRENSTAGALAEATDNATLDRIASTKTGRGILEVGVDVAGNVAGEAIAGGLRARKLRKLEGQRAAQRAAAAPVRTVDQEIDDAMNAGRSTRPPSAEAQAAALPAPVERRGMRRRLASAIAPEVDLELEQAKRLADTDALSGLPNRRALDRVLPGVEADPARGVVMFDANNFGKVNKAVSDAEGDKLIQQIGKALGDAAEEFGYPREIAARKGGDEFVLAGAKTEQLEAVKRRAEELFGEHRYTDAEGKEFVVSLSGHAGPNLAEADAGLQTAKKARKRAQFPRHDGQEFVNPIDPKLSPAQKAKALAELTADSRPALEELATALDEALPGTMTKANEKKLETVLEKAGRPAIRDEKPWHDVEHLRDGLRFKTSLNDLEDVPKVIEQARAAGFVPVKVDTDKWGNPKAYGWRFVAVDFRHPQTGQLLEWYGSPHEFIKTNKATHGTYEKWRNVKLGSMTPEQRAAFEADLTDVNAQYDSALETYLERTGKTRDQLSTGWADLQTRIHSAAGALEADPRAAAASAPSAAASSGASASQRMSAPASPVSASAASPNSQAPADVRAASSPVAGSSTAATLPDRNPSIAPPVGDAGKVPAVSPTSKLGGVEGREETVRFSDGRELPVRYRVVEAASLTPSHDPFSFAPNPAYPAGVQGRAYHGAQGKGARDQVELNTPKLREREVLDAGSSAAEGPPLVTPEGLVIAGNQRSMLVTRAHQLAPERSAAYKAELAKRAAVFGVDPAQLEGMTAPVLVREFTDPAVTAGDPGLLGELNRLSDTPAMKAKDVVSEGASRALQMQQGGRALAHFAATFENDGTLRAYLETKHGDEFVKLLQADGAIRPQEVARYVDVKTSALTRPGKLLVEDIMYNAAIGSADVVATAPASALEKIEHAIPSMVAARAAAGWDLSDPLREAFEIIQAKRKAELKSIDALVGQGDLLGREWSENGIALARMIDEAPKKAVADTFRRYAEAAVESKKLDGGADMFGNAETAETAGARLFQQRNRKGAIGGDMQGGELGVRMMASLSGTAVGGLAGAHAGAAGEGSSQERRDRALAWAIAGAAIGAGLPWADRGLAAAGLASRKASDVMRRTGAIGDTDLFGNVEKGAQQTDLLGAAPARTLSAEERAAAARIPRLKQELELVERQLGRAPNDRLVRRKGELSRELAQLSKLTNRGEKIGSEELGADLFGKRAGAIGDQPETIESAAIQTKDGRIFKGPLHILAVQAAEEAGAFGKELPGNAGYKSGFLTSEGRFVDRATATDLAERAQQGNVNYRAARRGANEGELDATDIHGREYVQPGEVPRRRPRSGAIGNQPDPAPITAPAAGRPAAPATAIDPEEFARLSKFSLDPSGEKTLRGEIVRVVKAEGLNPKAKVTHEQTAAIAKELGLDPAQFIAKEQLNGAELLAARNLVKANVDRLVSLERELLEHGLPDPKREQLEALRGVLEHHNDQLLGRFVRERSRAGRDLNSLKIAAAHSLDPVLWLTRAKRELGDKPLTDGIRTEILELINKQDRAGLAQRVAKLRTVSPWDKILTVWKAGLLTNPTTHIANLIGNSSMAALETVKDAPASAFDAMLSVISGQRTKAGLSTSAIASSWDGARRGVAEAREVIRNGTTAAQSAKLDMHREIDFQNPILDKYTKTIFRGLSATDQVFRGMALARSIDNQARTIARAEGLRGSARRNRIAQLVAAPTDEMSVRGIADAELATFNNNGVLAQVASGARKPLGPIGDIVLPFVRTPANVASRVAEYSPAGAAAAAAELLQAAFKRELPPELQRTLADRLGRSATGATVIAVGYYLAANEKLNAGRPTQGSGKADQFELEGKTANAVLVDGKWHALNRFSPLGNLLTLGAHIYNAEQEPNATPASVGMKAITGIGQNVTEQSFLRGASDIIDAVKGAPGAAERYLEGTAGSIVPAAVARVAGAVDPVVRETHGPVDAFKARVPGLSKTLEPKVNQFGEDVVREQGLAGSFFDPTNARQDRRAVDPLVAELARTGAQVTKLKRAKGEPASEFTNRRRLYGQALESVLQQVVASEEYQQIPTLARTMVDEQPELRGRDPAQLAKELQRSQLEDATRTLRRYLSQQSKLATAE